MKEETYILFTSGRGPVECALAVQGIQTRFKKYLAFNNVGYEIVNQKKGEFGKSIETIVFKVMTKDQQVIAPWLGTLQWICVSPIRKYHKRKNWYIKCQEIDIPEKTELCTNDVIIQTFKASGPGGQHRNKVETAVRIIHKSSGIIVTASDGKSQVQNKKKAWKKLLDKLVFQNQEILRNFDSDKWSSQIVIERGSPVRTFKGVKFIE